MKVSVVIGSISDRDVVDRIMDILRKFEIPSETLVLSAHRSPSAVKEFAEEAVDNGIEVIIAVAGKAAHLAGVIASMTTLPVIGVPAKSSFMDGLDSLLSTVQMPKGVPVATVAVDGAENAAILAAQILQLKYPELTKKLQKHKLEMIEDVQVQNSKLSR